MAKKPETYTLDPRPNAQIFQFIGIINIGWANLDHAVSSALELVTKLESAECAIMMGKVETLSKLNKIASILNYRGEKEKGAQLRKLSAGLDRFKEARNSITHGVFQGIIPTGEMLWAIPNDVVIHPSGSGRNIEVITADDVVKHGEALRLATETLVILFGPELQTAQLSSLNQLRSRSRRDPSSLGKTQTKPRRPPQPSGA